MHKNGPNTIFIMRVQCHGKSAVFARAGEGGGEDLHAATSYLYDRRKTRKYVRVKKWRGYA